MIQLDPMFHGMVFSVFKDETLYRLYPSLDLPVLDTLTKFTLAINATIQKYVPNPKVFCRLRHAYETYIQHAFLERVQSSIGMLL